VPLRLARWRAEARGWRNRAGTYESRGAASGRRKWALGAQRGAGQLSRARLHAIIESARRIIHHRSFGLDPVRRIIHHGWRFIHHLRRIIHHGWRFIHHRWRINHHRSRIIYDGSNT
jgi:hypothetical protein